MSRLQRFGWSVTQDDELFKLSNQTALVWIGGKMGAEELLDAFVQGYHGIWSSVVRVPPDGNTSGNRTPGQSSEPICMPHPLGCSGQSGYGVTSSVTPTFGGASGGPGTPNAQWTADPFNYAGGFPVGSQQAPMGTDSGEKPSS